MTRPQNWTPQPSQDPGDRQAARQRWARLMGMAAVLGLLSGSALVAWQCIGLLPRSVRREMTELFLHGVLIVYGLAVLLVPLGTAGLIGYLIRDDRQRRRHPRLARLALLGCASLVGLIGLELGAGVWEIWHHRLPALPITFSATAPKDSLHVVVIGESSALGEPYRPWLSVGQILGWRLQEVLPDRTVDVTILARLGACLRDMHFELRNLRRRPDLLVIYLGHNEFVARYEEERDVSLNEAPEQAWLGWLYRLSLKSPFCRLVGFVVSQNRLDGPPPPVSRHALIDPPQVSEREYAEVLSDFHRRFEAIVAWCDRIGCVPLLIVPPSNEADQEPSRSVLPASVSLAERQALTERFQAARRRETLEPEVSERTYREILEHYPGFAEAHYRLGRLEERRGLRAEANRHYRAALDHDGLNTRCNSDFQAVIRTIAAEHPSCLLVDGPELLRSLSPDGTLGDELIQDMHHPNLPGYVALAEASLHVLHDHRVFGWSNPMPEPIDARMAADHFGMDPEKWVTVCDRTRVHYERIARYRFDPTSRLLRAAAYGQAARRIAAGTPPDEAGVIGLGVNFGSSAPRP